MAVYDGRGGWASVGGIPGQATISFRIDGEGRPSSLTQGTTTFVSGTTYNANSQPLRVNYGTSTDNDTFAYDPNTFRMSTYTFNVGSPTKSLSGALTWNPNATLRQLALNDQFNPADTQTCTYGYDDLARVASANCGSVWAQTFAPDRFGNLQKSGSSAWLATYSGNRTKTIPGCSPPAGNSDFHDANGNLLKDCTNTYTWDADNRPSKINSVNIVTDAFHRESEFGSSAYTEVLYSPIGKLGTMNGQTLNRILLPLPGGGKLE